MSADPAPLELLGKRLAFYLHKRQGFRAFAASLPLLGHEQVMDYNCGMGAAAFYTAKRLAGGRLVCADASIRWLRACRKTLRRCGHVSFALPDDPGIVDGSFDLIYGYCALHRLPQDELARVMARMAALLKPGGLLVLRESADEMERMKQIRHLALQNGLRHRSSRVTDAGGGNALESLYRKNEEI